MSLPPGPSGKLKTTWQILSRPEESYLRWLEKYGDPFTLHAANGTVVMTARADEVHRIFAAPPGTFGVFGVDATKVVTGPSSVIITDEPRHMKDRKLLMPPFHGDRMRAYGEMMRATAQAALDDVLTTGGGNGLAVGQAMTLDIILRAVFGIDDDERFAAARKSVLESVESLHPSFLFLPALQREGMGLLPFAKYMRAYRAADDLMQEQIDLIRDHAEGREDILSLLLSARYDDGAPMADADIKDQLRTLLFAGHETTAITLAWALYELARAPEVLADIQRELDASDDDLPRSALLAAAVKETLRLHPPVLEVMREVKTSWTVAGYDVPQGAYVAAFIWLAHRNPEVYPEPLAFKPRRFLEQTFGPDVFMPFGGGNRRCIGAAFAQYELETVLGTWLRDVDVALVDDAPVRAVRRNVTMAPEGGIDFTVTRRAGSSGAVAA